MKTLRQELKQALDELNDKILIREHKEHRSNDKDNDKFLHNFDNVMFRLLKNGEQLPIEIGSWMNYDELKMQCLARHEEMKIMLEKRNKVSENSLARY